MKKLNIILFIIGSIIFFNIEVRGEDLPVEFGDKNMETVDEVITWGVGVASSVSLLICNKAKGANPSPISFYVFNSAGIGYFALDKLIDDEDTKRRDEIGKEEYSGSNDEQMNAYLRARDIAIANMEHAKEKAKYKQAASIVMLSAAVLAYKEKKNYWLDVKLSKNNVRSYCATSAAEVPVLFFKSRCRNVGGAKVICNKSDSQKLKKLYNLCKNSSATMALDSSCTIGIEKGYSTVAKVEKRESIGDVKESKLFTTIEDNNKLNQVKSAARGSDPKGIERSGILYNNPITSLLTLGGYQYEPGSRSVIYALLGGIVASNAFFNKVAADKYEEERDYYQSLIDGMNECGDNCISSGDSSGEGSGEGGNDDGLAIYPGPIIPDDPTPSCFPKEDFSNITLRSSYTFLKNIPITTSLSATRGERDVTLNHAYSNTWPGKETTGPWSDINQYVVVFNKSSSDECQWSIGSTFYAHKGDVIGQIGSSSFYGSAAMITSVDEANMERTNIVTW